MEKDNKKDTEASDNWNINAQILETLLETNLWKGIIEFMESTAKSTKELRFFYSNFAEKSVNPLLNDITVMSEESKNVSAVIMA